MNKNRKRLSPSFFKAILFVLVASSFSISSSYGESNLLKQENVDFRYGVPQVKWNRDIKRTVIDIVLMIDAEDKGKLKMPFLFFKLCDKPDELWFFGQRGDVIEGGHHLKIVWKKYQVGEEPLSYDYSGVSLGVLLELRKNTPFYKMTTSPLITTPPIDISSICGALFAGYGLGKTRQEAYDEMLSQKRFGEKFHTIRGVNLISYDFEVKVVETYAHRPVINLGTCADGYVRRCPIIP
jgi:hypothetical protein